jgi:hypothetical protein
MTKGEAQRLRDIMVQHLQWYFARGSMSSWVLTVVYQEDNERRVEPLLHQGRLPGAPDALPDLA